MTDFIESLKQQGSQAAPEMLDGILNGELSLEINEKAFQNGNQAMPDILEALQENQGENVQLGMQQGNQSAPNIIDAVENEEITSFITVVPVFSDSCTAMMWWSDPSTEHAEPITVEASLGFDDTLDAQGNVNSEPLKWQRSTDGINWQDISESDSWYIRIRENNPGTFYYRVICTPGIKTVDFTYSSLNHTFKASLLDVQNYIERITVDGNDFPLSDVRVFAALEHINYFRISFVVPGDYETLEIETKPLVLGEMGDYSPAMLEFQSFEIRRKYQQYVTIDRTTVTFTNVRDDSEISENYIFYE